MDIASELRCLVCQNQTLADSNAELAVDLRNSIREQLGRGASEREVLDFMVARYGDFVLYRPPLKATTVLLWGGPFLFLGAGLFILLRRCGASAPRSSRCRMKIGRARRSCSTRAPNDGRRMIVFWISS